MAFYSAKNVDLLLNDSGYYVSEASIEASVSLSPVHRIGSSVTDEYSAEAGTEGVLSFKYYLTGADPIKSFMETDGAISGNFCGLYFKSGYLKSYSMNAVSYGPVQVDASLIFFQEPSGTFASRESSLTDIDVLNFSDFQFNEAGILNAKNLISLEYSYETNFNAFYNVQEVGENVVPVRVRGAEKTISLEVTTNDYTLNLPPTGLEGTATIILKDSLGVQKESYDISGRMYSKNMTISSSDILTKKLSINQSNLAMPPSIETIIPSTGPVGTLVKVSGVNIKNVETVQLSQQVVEFESYPPTGVHFSMPADIATGVGGAIGPIKIFTKGGKTISTTSFLVTTS